MHCYTEVAAGKARADYDSSLLAANKLTKTKAGDLDGYGAGRGAGRITDGKEESTAQNNANDYTMPDGSKISIFNADKARAPEILFKPSLIGLEYPGIHELVSNCIKACDIDLRAGL